MGAVRQPAASVDDPENADRTLDPLRFPLLRFEAFEQAVKFATVDAEYRRGLGLVSILLIRTSKTCSLCMSSSLTPSSGLTGFATTA